MGKTKQAIRQEGELAWQHLQTSFPSELLHAPLVDWNRVEPTLIRYLYNEVRDTPWFYHLAFCIAILVSHTQLDWASIRSRCYHFHARFRVLFPRYGITSFEEWNPQEHVRRYINDAELADTLQVRQDFLHLYSSSARHAATYLRALPDEVRPVYQRWVFPPMPLDLYQTYSRRGLVQAEQHQRRKAETDAIAPHFSRIRGEGHLRLNQLKRLQDKFREAVALIESGQEVLPLNFSYEEARLGQRYFFRLWDRYSFFEHHAHQYAPSMQKEYKSKYRVFAPENNHFFLEFLHAEGLSDGAKDENALLWFGDLLRYELFGHRPINGSEEEVQRKQNYLRSWGYGEEGGNEGSCPFVTGVPGLLTATWSQGHYLDYAQRFADGILFLVEPLYVGAIFGLAALDLFTTTGARHNEVLQISLDPNCLYTVEIEGKLHYCRKDHKIATSDA